MISSLNILVGLSLGSGGTWVVGISSLNILVGLSLESGEIQYVYLFSKYSRGTVSRKWCLYVVGMTEIYVSAPLSLLYC